MKLEEGMYVRTKGGFIDKIISFKSTISNDYVELEDEYYANKKDILKASHNIIDLVQENDFVNGEKVSSIQYEGVGFEHIKCVQTICKFDSLDNQFYTETYFDKEIKSIVTKEQFSQMEYRLGGDVDDE